MAKNWPLYLGLTLGLTQGYALENSIDLTQPNIDKQKKYEKQVTIAPIHKHEHSAKKNHNSANKMYAASKIQIFEGMSESLLNISSMRLDRKILEKSQANSKFSSDNTSLSAPKLILSAKLEGLMTVVKKVPELELSTAEVAGLVIINPYINGFFNFGVEDDETVALKQAFFTLGNLAKSPTYVTIGKFYLPFGLYHSNMIKSPLTKKLGRTNANAASINYSTKDDKSLFNTSFYIFDSKVKDASTRFNGTGLDLNYTILMSKNTYVLIGASWISSLSSSDALQDQLVNGAEDPTINFHGLSKHPLLGKDVAGVAIYSEVKVNNITFNIEYLQAVSAYDVKDIRAEARDPNSASAPTSLAKGAAPSALYTELSINNLRSYNNKPASLALGYGTTTDAALLGLPESKYAINYNVAVAKNMTVSIGYERAYNYPWMGEFRTNTFLAQVQYII